MAQLDDYVQALDLGDLSAAGVVAELNDKLDTFGLSGDGTLGSIIKDLSTALKRERSGAVQLVADTDRKSSAECAHLVVRYLQELVDEIKLSTVVASGEHHLPTEDLVTVPRSVSFKFLKRLGKVYHTHKAFDDKYTYKMTQRVLDRTRPVYLALLNDPTSDLYVWKAKEYRACLTFDAIMVKDVPEWFHHRTKHKLTTDKGSDSYVFKFDGAHTFLGVILVQVKSGKACSITYKEVGGIYNVEDVLKTCGIKIIKAYFYCPNDWWLSQSRAARDTRKLHVDVEVVQFERGQNHTWNHKNVPDNNLATKTEPTKPTKPALGWMFMPWIITCLLSMVGPQPTENDDDDDLSFARFQDSDRMTRVQSVTRSGKSGIPVAIAARNGKPTLLVVRNHAAMVQMKRDINSYDSSVLDDNFKAGVRYGFDDINTSGTYKTPLLRIVSCHVFHRLTRDTYDLVATGLQCMVIDEPHEYMNLESLFKSLDELFGVSSKSRRIMLHMLHVVPEAVGMTATPTWTSPSHFAQPRTEFKKTHPGLLPDINVNIVPCEQKFDDAGSPLFQTLFGPDNEYDKYSSTGDDNNETKQQQPNNTKSRLERFAIMRQAVETLQHEWIDQPSRGQVMLVKMYSNADVMRMKYLLGDKHTLVYTPSGGKIPTEHHWYNHKTSTYRSTTAGNRPVRIVLSVYSAATGVSKNTIDAVAVLGTTWSTRLMIQFLGRGDRTLLDILLCFHFVIDVTRSASTWDKVMTNFATGHNVPVRSTDTGDTTRTFGVDGGLTINVAIDCDDPDRALAKRQEQFNVRFWADLDMCRSKRTRKWLIDIHTKVASARRGPSNTFTPGSSTLLLSPTPMDLVDDDTDPNIIIVTPEMIGMDLDKVDTGNMDHARLFMSKFPLFSLTYNRTAAVNTPKGSVADWACKFGQNLINRERKNGPTIKTLNTARAARIIDEVHQAVFGTGGDTGVDDDDTDESTTIVTTTADTTSVAAASTSTDENKQHDDDPDSVLIGIVTTVVWALLTLKDKCFLRQYCRWMDVVIDVHLPLYKRYGYTNGNVAGGTASYPYRPRDNKTNDEKAHLAALKKAVGDGGGADQSPPTLSPFREQELNLGNFIKKFKSSTTNHSKAHPATHKAVVVLFDHYDAKFEAAGFVNAMTKDMSGYHTRKKLREFIDKQALPQRLSADDDGKTSSSPSIEPLQQVPCMPDQTHHHKLWAAHNDASTKNTNTSTAKTRVMFLESPFYMRGHMSTCVRDYEKCFMCKVGDNRVGDKFPNAKAKRTTMPEDERIVRLTAAQTAAKPVKKKTKKKKTKKKRKAASSSVSSSSSSTKTKKKKKKKK
jgi:hypothetical protein